MSTTTDHTTVRYVSVLVTTCSRWLPAHFSMSCFTKIDSSAALVATKVGNVDSSRKSEVGSWVVTVESVVNEKESSTDGAVDVYRWPGGKIQIHQSHFHQKPLKSAPVLGEPPQNDIFVFFCWSLPHHHCRQHEKLNNNALIGNFSRKLQRERDVGVGGFGCIHVDNIQPRTGSSGFSRMVTTVLQDCIRGFHGGTH